MISRLMLNLRDPALVGNTRKNGPLLTDDMTYPNLTFADAVFTTVQSTVDEHPLHAEGRAGYEYCTEEGELPRSRRRIREVYSYLAMGTSHSACFSFLITGYRFDNVRCLIEDEKDVELLAVRREH